MARELKHPMPTMDECEHNIASVWAECSHVEIAAWRNWYREEHAWADRIASATGYSLLITAAVAAAMSPRINWNLAKLACEDLLHDRMVSVGIAKNVDKAKQCKAGNTEALRGPKVIPFGELLVNPELPDRVVIDTWAIRVALGDSVVITDKNISNYASNPARLATMRQAYINVARRLNVLPSELQAVTWCKLNPDYNAA